MLLFRLCKQEELKSSLSLYVVLYEKTTFHPNSKMSTRVAQNDGSDGLIRRIVFQSEICGRIKLWRKKRNISQELSYLLHSSPTSAYGLTMHVPSSSSICALFCCPPSPSVLSLSSLSSFSSLSSIVFLSWLSDRLICRTSRGVCVQSRLLASTRASRWRWRLWRAPSSGPWLDLNFRAIRCLPPPAVRWFAPAVFSSLKLTRGSAAGGSGIGIETDIGGSGRGIFTDMGDSGRWAGLVSGEMAGTCLGIEGVSVLSSVGVLNNSSLLAIWRRLRSWLALCSHTDMLTFLLLSRRLAKALVPLRGCSSGGPAAQSGSSGKLGRPLWIARFLYR